MLHQKVEFLTGFGYETKQNLNSKGLECCGSYLELCLQRCGDHLVFASNTVGVIWSIF